MFVPQGMPVNWEEDECDLYSMAQQRQLSISSLFDIYYTSLNYDISGVNILCKLYNHVHRSIV